jgi:hypothetical protein
VQIWRQKSDISHSKIFDIPTPKILESCKNSAKLCEGLNFSAETLSEILSLAEILGKNFWHNKTSGKVSVRKVWPPRENFCWKYFRTKVRNSLAQIIDTFYKFRLEDELSITPKIAMGTKREQSVIRNGM